LCEDTPESFSQALNEFLKNQNLSKTMGVAGIKRVKELFGPEAFSHKLKEIISALLGKKRI
jgi:glycosyltransferase involved in cell wall biosynthesis